jgi:hypothetical protein
MKFFFFKRSELAIGHGAPGWVQQQATAARFAAQLSASTHVDVNVNVNVDVNGSSSNAPRSLSHSRR